MKLYVERDPQGALVVRQHAGYVLRYVLGVPLLLGGAFMLYGVFSSFIIQMQEQGIDGILEALLGSFFLLIFTGLLLPLGWWLTFSRHWVLLEPGPRDVVEVSDWRIGRREKRTPASAFRAVRVATEPLGSGASSNSDGRVVYCQKIRLLPKKPGEQHSLGIGALDEKDRNHAIAFGQQIAGFLGLPVEIAGADAVLDSPERVAADEEVRDATEHDEA